MIQVLKTGIGQQEVTDYWTVDKLCYEYLENGHWNNGSVFMTDFAEHYENKYTYEELELIMQSNSELAHELVYEYITRDVEAE